MATSAPASFHEPAPYSPDGPYDVPESDVDADYAEFLPSGLPLVKPETLTI